MTPEKPGSALLALARTMLDVLRTRAELLAVELAQEKARLARLAVRAGVALLSLCLCLQLLAVLAVAWFWDTPHRLAAVLAVGAVFALAAITACLMLWHELRSAPPPFAGSLQALSADLGERG